MFEWISTLPVVWIALFVLAAMALLTAGIYALVVRLAQGERANAFQALSPGMLPPMGILFALFVGFLAVGVWGNVDRADDAVADEASALRAVVILSGELPPDQRGRMRALVRSQIETAVNDEWPAMEKRRADLTAIPTALAQALHLAFGFHPQGEGQVMAQRELVTAVRDALAARRQRIVVSESSVNTVKWLGALALAALTLLAIALVHSDNRVTARIAMGLFAVAVAAVITMLAAQDQPFAGQLGIDPDVLEQVRPRAG